MNDLCDPTFFMINFACLLNWSSFDRVNWKPNLIVMSRHLFNKRDEIRYIVDKCKHLPKARLENNE